MRLLQFYIGYLRRFFHFYKKALTIYDVHSPFVASFLRFVFMDDRAYYSFRDIEQFRALLLKNRYRIRIVDFGAGSRANPSQWREVRDIVRHGAVSGQVGRFLFRAVLFVRPGSMLEMGTSLGISTLYLRTAGARRPFITMEGCPDIAVAARDNLLRLGCSDVEVVEGPFSETLHEVLDRYGQLDFLYLDGDHRAGSSYAYFLACLEKAGPRSVFVIADIHWSEEMEAAWARMQAHPRVCASVDNFHLGFLFFDKAIKTPVHLRYVPWIYKPWRSGIFH
jgi:predicted O-methyltransferase YrrM